MRSSPRFVESLLRAASGTIRIRPAGDQTACLSVSRVPLRRTAASDKLRDGYPVTDTEGFDGLIAPMEIDDGLRKERQAPPEPAADAEDESLAFLVSMSASSPKPRTESNAARRAL